MSESLNIEYFITFVCSIIVLRLAMWYILPSTVEITWIMLVQSGNSLWNMFHVFRALMRRSLCGTSWMSLEVAFSTPTLLMSALFHSATYRLSRHSLWCGHWPTSMKEVSGIF